MLAILLIFMMLITVFRLKKKKKTGVAAAGGTKGFEISVPLKYLSNFLRTLEMPLINCEINLIF